MSSRIIVLILLPFLLNIISASSEDGLKYKDVKITTLDEIDIDDVIDDEGDINFLRTDDRGNVCLNFLTGVRIYRFDKNLKKLNSFNIEGDGPREMNGPVAFAIVGDEISVSDENASRLAIFNYNGVFRQMLFNRSGGGQWLLSLGNRVIGIDKTPVGMLDQKAEKIISRFYVENTSLIKDSMFCMVNPVGTYLTNQLSDYLVVGDSLLFLCYRYQDRILKINLNNFMLREISSPLRIHLKSSVMGNSSVSKNGKGGKKYSFKLTGEEYLCYSSLTRYKDKLAALFWARKPNSFSFTDMLSGKNGGRILCFFDLKEGRYLYSVNLPDPLLRVAYSPLEDTWFAVDAAYTLKKYKIGGLDDAD